MDIKMRNYISTKISKMLYRVSNKKKERTRPRVLRSMKHVMYDVDNDDDSNDICFLLYATLLHTV